MNIVQSNTILACFNIFELTYLLHVLPLILASEEGDSWAGAIDVDGVVPELLVILWPLLVSHLSFLASIVLPLSSESSATSQKAVIISSGVAPRSAAWGIFSLYSVRKNRQILIGL